MKNRWRTGLGVLAALAAQAWANAQAPLLQPEELYERLAPSVWLVVVDVGGGASSQGSAVVVGPGTLVTNCHVVDKARSIRVMNESQEFAARLQYRDPTRDLCQLQAPGLAAPPVRVAAGAGLRVGTKVYAIGSPRGLELTLSDGLVSGLRRNRDGGLERVQISVPISPGSSGGGLFDGHGQLVGITTSGFRDSQNLNFALPADWIAELAPRAGGTATLRLDPRIVAAAPVPSTAIVAATPAPSIAVTPTPTPAPAAPQGPPPAAMRPAPVPFPAVAAPRMALPPVAVGQAFEYQWRDRVSRNTRTVIFRLDRIEGDRLVFNDGARVEQADGEVVSLAGAIAGEFEEAMPAGGWFRGAQQSGPGWPGRFTALGDGRPYLMELRLQSRSEGTFHFQGRDLPTVGLHFRGYTTRGGGISTNPPGVYAATAWYAPELKRVVRFEARSRGGLGHTAFIVDEVLELVAVRPTEAVPQ